MSSDDLKSEKDEGEEENDIHDDLDYSVFSIDEVRNADVKELILLEEDSEVALHQDPLPGQSWMNSYMKSCDRRKSSDWSHLEVLFCPFRQGKPKIPPLNISDIPRIPVLQDSSTEQCVEHNSGINICEKQYLVMSENSGVKNISRKSTPSLRKSSCSPKKSTSSPRKSSSSPKKSKLSPRKLHTSPSLGKIHEYSHPFCSSNTSVVAQPIFVMLDKRPRRQAIRPGSFCSMRRRRYSRRLERVAMSLSRTQGLKLLNKTWSHLCEEALGTPSSGSSYGQSEHNSMYTSTDDQDASDASSSEFSTDEESGEEESEHEGRLPRLEFRARIMAMLKRLLGSQRDSSFMSGGWFEDSVFRKGKPKEHLLNRMVKEMSRDCIPRERAGRKSGETRERGSKKDVDREAVAREGSSCTKCGQHRSKTHHRRHRLRDREEKKRTYPARSKDNMTERDKKRKEGHKEDEEHYKLRTQKDEEGQEVDERKKVLYKDLRSCHGVENVKVEDLQYTHQEGEEVETVVQEKGCDKKSLFCFKPSVVDPKERGRALKSKGAKGGTEGKSDFEKEELEFTLHEDQSRVLIKFDEEEDEIFEEKKDNQESLPQSLPVKDELCEVIERAVAEAGPPEAIDQEEDYGPCIVEVDEFKTIKEIPKGRIDDGPCEVDEFKTIKDIPRGRIDSGTCKIIPVYRERKIFKEMEEKKKGIYQKKGQIKTNVSDVKKGGGGDKKLMDDSNLKVSEAVGAKTDEPKEPVQYGDITFDWEKVKKVEGDTGKPHTKEHIDDKDNVLSVELQEAKDADAIHEPTKKTTVEAEGHQIATGAEYKVEEPETESTFGQIQRAISDTGLSSALYNALPAVVPSTSRMIAQHLMHQAGKIHDQNTCLRCVPPRRRAFYIPPKPCPIYLNYEAGGWKQILRRGSLNEETEDEEYEEEAEEQEAEEQEAEKVIAKEPAPCTCVVRQQEKETTKPRPRQTEGDRWKAKGYYEHSAYEEEPQAAARRQHVQWALPTVFEHEMEPEGMEPHVHQCRYCCPAACAVHGQAHPHEAYFQPQVEEKFITRRSPARESKRVYRRYRSAGREKVRKPGTHREKISVNSGRRVLYSDSELDSESSLASLHSDTEDPRKSCVQRITMKSISGEPSAKAGVSDYGYDRRDDVFRSRDYSSPYSGFSGFNRPEPSSLQPKNLTRKVSWTSTAKAAKKEEEHRKGLNRYEKFLCPDTGLTSRFEGMKTLLDECDRLLDSFYRSKSSVASFKAPAKNWTDQAPVYIPVKKPGTSGPFLKDEDRTYQNDDQVFRTYQNDDQVFHSSKYEDRTYPNNDQVFHASKYEDRDFLPAVPRLAFHPERPPFSSYTDFTCVNCSTQEPARSIFPSTNTTSIRPRASSPPIFRHDWGASSASPMQPTPSLVNSLTTSVYGSNFDVGRSFTPSSSTYNNSTMKLSELFPKSTPNPGVNESQNKIDELYPIPLPGTGSLTSICTALQKKNNYDGIEWTKIVAEELQSYREKIASWPIWEQIQKNTESSLKSHYAAQSLFWRHRYSQTLNKLQEDPICKGFLFNKNHKCSSEGLCSYRLWPVMLLNNKPKSPFE